MRAGPLTPSTLLWRSVLVGIALGITALFAPEGVAAVGFTIVAAVVLHSCRHDEHRPPSPHPSSPPARTTRPAIIHEREE